MPRINNTFTYPLKLTVTPHDIANVSTFEVKIRRISEKGLMRRRVKDTLYVVKPSTYIRLVDDVSTNTVSQEFELYNHENLF